MYNTKMSYFISFLMLLLRTKMCSSSRSLQQVDSPFLKPFNNVSDETVLTDYPPFVKIYRNGTVERYFASPIVPPSLDDPSTGVATKDVTISGEISARIYIPAAELAGDKKLAVLVYFHGGGFIVESAFSFLDEQYLKQIVMKSGTIIVSVEYRRAPEHYLPVAYGDCWAGLQWVASHAKDDLEVTSPREPWLIKHGDFHKLYLGGDSAGGNLAYNTAMRAGSEKLACDVKISGTFLGCPCFGDSEFKKGTNNISETYRLWSFVYPSAPGGINNSLINPFSDEPNSPEISYIGSRKVMVITVEKDDLREINLRYAAALRKSGVNVKVIDVKGENHSFYTFEPFGEKAQSVISKLAAFIKA